MKKILIILTAICLMLTMTGCIASIVEKIVDTAVSVISPKETEPAGTKAPAHETSRPEQPSNTATGSPSDNEAEEPVPGKTEENGESAEAEKEVFEENCREAYAAYRVLLCDNWELILKYNWQNGYYGYQPWQEEMIPTPVAIADIAGDDVPELIYIAGDAKYEYMTHLYVYTYRDGELLMLHDRIWDVMAGGGFYYTLFQVQGEKDLYAYYSTGDESWDDYIIHLSMNSAGNYLRAEEYLHRETSHEYNEKTGEYRAVKEYWINEAEVDEEEFDKVFGRFVDSVEKVIMDTSRSDTLEGVPDAGVSHTLVEAVDWLADQQPKREDFDFVWACGRDGDDVEAMLDLRAGMLIIHGTGDMDDALSPWSEYANHIRHVVVCEGITSIQNLSSLRALKDIYLPKSLEMFGRVSLGYTGVNYMGGAFDGFTYYNLKIYYAGSEEEYAKIQDEADRGKGYMFGTFADWIPNTGFDWSLVNYKGVRH